MTKQYPLTEYVLALGSLGMINLDRYISPHSPIRFCPYDRNKACCEWKCDELCKDYKKDEAKE